MHLRQAYFSYNFVFVGFYLYFKQNMYMVHYHYHIYAQYTFPLIPLCVIPSVPICIFFHRSYRYTFNMHYSLPYSFSIFTKSIKHIRTFFWSSIKHIRTFFWWCMWFTAQIPLNWIFCGVHLLSIQFLSTFWFRERNELNNFQIYW